MNIKTISITAVAALFCLNAIADDLGGISGSNNFNNALTITDNSGTLSTSSNAFADNGALTSSALNATIASNNSDFTFDTAQNGNYEGNYIGNKAFAGVIGVAAVNQNSGLNSNSQQSIVFINNGESFQ